MTLAKIPTPTEVRNGGGNELVRQALMFLEPVLFALESSTIQIKAVDLIHAMYSEEVGREAAKRVIQILRNHGWKAEMYEREGETWLEIGQPDKL